MLLLNIMLVNIPMEKFDGEIATWKNYSDIIWKNLGYGSDFPFYCNLQYEAYLELCLNPHMHVHVRVHTHTQTHKQEQ